LNITDKQKELLKKYKIDYDNLSFRNILSELDWVMLDSLENEEATPETAIISHLYDELYMQNK